MLILKRHRGETLMIGEDVTVTVLDIQGSQVRLGVTAPKKLNKETRWNCSLSLLLLIKWISFQSFLSFKVV